MTALTSRWFAIFNIYAQEAIAYRAGVFIWFLVEAITSIVMPLVWIASMGTSTSHINEFAPQDFVIYYLGILGLSSFVTSHLMWELGIEIKEGHISTLLMRPISFTQFMSVRNLAYRCMRIFATLPLMFLLYVAFKSFLIDPILHLNIYFWITLFLGHAISFFFVLAMSTIAFFVHETYAIFRLYYVPMYLFSGKLVPVDFLPAWLHKFTVITPFYYTVGVPTEILMGRLNANQTNQAMINQCVWIIICFEPCKSKK